MSGYTPSALVRKIRSLKNETGTYQDLKRAAEERDAAGREAFMAAQNLVRFTTQYTEYDKKRRTADDTFLRYCSDKVVCGLIKFIVAEEDKNIKKRKLDILAETFFLSKENNSSQPQGTLQERLYTFLGIREDVGFDPITVQLKRDVGTIINGRIGEEAANPRAAQIYSEYIGHPYVRILAMFNPSRAPGEGESWELPELKAEEGAREAAAEFLLRDDVAVPTAPAAGSVEVTSYSMDPAQPAHAPMNEGTRRARLAGALGSLTTSRPPARTSASALNRLTLRPSAGAGGRQPTATAGTYRLTDPRVELPPGEGSLAAARRAAGLLNIREAMEHDAQRRRELAIYSAEAEGGGGSAAAAAPSAGAGGAGRGPLNYVALTAARKREERLARQRASGGSASAGGGGGGSASAGGGGGGSASAGGGGGPGVAVEPNGARGSGVGLGSQGGRRTKNRRNRNKRKTKSKSKSKRNTRR